jgi:hypothetical protein
LTLVSGRVKDCERLRVAQIHILMGLLISFVMRGDLI